MSQTAAVTELNIRRMIDDLDKDDYAISSVRMRNIIVGNVQALAARLHMPILASPPTTVTLVAGTYDYTLGSSGVTIAVRQVILNSTGLELERMPFDDLNAHYRQDTAVPLGSGPPRHFAVYETNAQLMRLRVAPTPADSDSLKVYRDAQPTAGAGDTAAIPFETLMCQAVEAACAAECVLSMPQAEREKRMISRDVVALWQRGVDDAVRAENLRQRFAGRSQQYIQRVEA